MSAKISDLYPGLQAAQIRSFPASFLFPYCLFAKAFLLFPLTLRTAKPQFPMPTILVAVVFDTLRLVLTSVSVFKFMHTILFLVVLVSTVVSLNYSPAAPLVLQNL